MQHSEHYSLQLPQPEDPADIAPLRDNFSLLDGILWENAQTAAAQAAQCLPLAGGTLSGPLTLAHDPTQPLHAATRQYVEARLVQTGMGDMLQAVYDPAGSGMVEKAQDAQAHIARTDNPHGVTKAQVGLGSADNTPDAEKHVRHALTAASADVVDGGTY